MKVFEATKRVKLVLITSVLLNLLLVGEVFHLKNRQPEGAIIQGGQVLGDTSEAPAPPPFQWSQLESPDYPNYIANLRAIGCPERTVRELIAADLNDSFAPRREPLLARLASASASAIDRNQAQIALSQLRQEEVAVFRQLFGLPRAEAAAVSAAQPSATLPIRIRQPGAEDTSAIMPMVFQPVNTNAVELTAEEREAVEQVRESFRAALGTNQDLNSPDYLHRWQIAQKQADSLLDALIGRQAWLKYEDALQREKPNSD